MSDQNRIFAIAVESLCVFEYLHSSVFVSISEHIDWLMKIMVTYQVNWQFCLSAKPEVL